MYIPKHFQSSNRDKAVEFIRRFNFGILISETDGKPIATHIPFSISQIKDDVILESHLARANEQWKTLEGKKCLAIFSEPHAYISTSHYIKQENVPTWNYVAVHCYGTIEVIKEEEEAFRVLESMISQIDNAYRPQWDSLSDHYKQKMVKGIVAFRLKIEEWQAAEKLSQNKQPSEKQSIINALTNSENSSERWVGEFMGKR